MTKVTNFGTHLMLASSLWANITFLAAEGQDTDQCQDVGCRDMTTCLLQPSFGTNTIKCRFSKNPISLFCFYTQKNYQCALFCRVLRVRLKLSSQSEFNRWNIAVSERDITDQSTATALLTKELP